MLTDNSTLQGTRGDLRSGQLVESWRDLHDGLVLPTGYTVCLVHGPLKKARFINESIEQELAEFKEEIRQKFDVSQMNKAYVFPRVQRP